METSLQPKSQLQPCKMSKNNLLVDEISELPNDVLVTILSFLTMKEAARTCILSHRWKNFWKLITSRLDFDDWNVLQGISVRFLESLIHRVRTLESGHLYDKIKYELNGSPEWWLLQKRRSKYVKWVDQILESHKGAYIDTLKLHFDLDLAYRPQVDRWVEFATEKRVQRLELDLKRLYRDTKDCYPFPLQILGHRNISFLKALSLNYVDVTKENLESLLLKCPSLEFLSVSTSESLVGQLFIGLSLKLKHLEIVRCPRLEDLRISAPNLRSLKFVGPATTRVKLENTPNLAVVSFGGRYCQDKIYAFPRLPPNSPFRSQLRKLSLDIDIHICGNFPEFPSLSKLEQLELVLTASDKYSILGCTSMIKACPVLYRLKLGFKWWSPLKKKREVEKEKCLLPKGLKVVELSNFRGGITDVEMATFLFENAQFLEKIVIDTRSGNRHLVDERKTAKGCARQLATQVYPSAELMIL